MQIFVDFFKFQNKSCYFFKKHLKLKLVNSKTNNKKLICNNYVINIGVKWDNCGFLYLKISILEL